MEAASAISRSGLEEEGSYSWVVSDRFCDLVHIDAGYCLGYVGDCVDEADLCCQKRVAGILDKFCSLGAGENYGREILAVEPPV